MQIGVPPWNRTDIDNQLEAFASLYSQRPIQDNAGGIRAPHMFATWFMLKQLAPKVVIESGVWKGASTWLIEQACPDAQLYCIDPNLNNIIYESRKATYFDKDFSTLDWKHLPKRDTLLFFDDHQNAYERLKTVKWFGFEHSIFEDNYPAGLGDCYSLKKAFLGSGHHFDPYQGKKWQAKWQSFLSLLAGSEHKLPRAEIVQPNGVDRLYIEQNVEIYYEFPPVYKPSTTRWGDAWEEGKYPTPSPILEKIEQPYQQVFYDEAVHYTWICYVKLKSSG